MSATVSISFSPNDCAGAPQALLRGGLYDGSTIELMEVKAQEVIHISVHGHKAEYHKTEALERGKIIYLAAE